MKLNKIVYLFIFSVLLFACKREKPAPELVSAVMCKENVNGLQTIENRYKPGDGPFHITVVLKNVTDSTHVGVKWYAVKVENTNENTLLAEKQISYKKKQKNGEFNLSLDRPWPKGEYKAEIFIQQKSVQTVLFKVEE